MADSKSMLQLRYHILSFWLADMASFLRVQHFREQWDQYTKKFMNYGTAKIRRKWEVQI